MSHCTEIQLQFQQSNQTETQEGQRVFLPIRVIIKPASAILKTEVTLNFTVVNGNATGKARSCLCYNFIKNGCVSFTVTFFNPLAVNEDFVLLFPTLTLCRGTNDNNVQSLVVDIIDDSVPEGTESFNIFGDATAPASFVTDRDSAIVNILDNDGAWLVYAQASRFLCCMISSHAEYESRFC